MLLAGANATRLLPRLSDQTPGQCPGRLGAQESESGHVRPLHMGSAGGAGWRGEWPAQPATPSPYRRQQAAARAGDRQTGGAQTDPARRGGSCRRERLELGGVEGGGGGGVEKEKGRFGAARGPGTLRARRRAGSARRCRPRFVRIAMRAVGRGGGEPAAAADPRQHPVFHQGSP